nr:cytosine permease [Burkholderia sp. PAMC 26561]
MRETSERSNTAPGHRIAMILLGIAVTPVLLSSSSLGSQLSSSALIKVVVLGSIILTILSIITICVGEKARMPTYGIVKYPFGEKGAIAINILLAVSLFGWIAVTANMFGHSVHDLLAQHGINLPVPILVAIGCVIFVAATAFGFELLGKVAQFAVPVIALMLAYCLYVAAHGSAEVPVRLAEMNTGVAVSTVVGTIIVLVATLPDFGSFVHDRKHAIIGAGMTFLIAYPLLYWAGATPSGNDRAEFVARVDGRVRGRPSGCIAADFCYCNGQCREYVSGDAGCIDLVHAVSQAADHRCAGRSCGDRGEHGYHGMVHPVSAVSWNCDAAGGGDLYRGFFALSAQWV